MAYYRAYIIGPDGHFLEAVNLDCANDAAAIESIKQFVDGRDVEVWQEGRMVAKLARWGMAASVGAQSRRHVVCA